jgi:hypothetical protein
MDKHGARWTRSDWEQLHHLAAQKETISQAAQSMSRTESSLRHAAQRLLTAADVEIDHSDPWLQLAHLTSLHKIPIGPPPRSNLSSLYSRDELEPEGASSESRLETTDATEGLESVHAPDGDFPEGAQQVRTATALRDSDIPLTLIDAISYLPQERMQHILLTRLGVSSRAETLAEIGAELHISRERVRQVQEKALTRLCCKGRKGGGPGSVLRRSLPIDGATAGDTDALRQLIEIVQSQFDCETTLGLTILLRASGVLKAEAIRATQAARSILADRRQAEKSQRQRVRIAKRANVRVNKWIEMCEWPTQLRTAYSTSRLASQRAPGSGLGHSGEFYSHKLQRNVLYESSLELDTLNVLENDASVVYYLEQPTRIPYRFDARQRTYFPDIFVALRDGRAMFVEVKPLWQMALRINQTKANAGRSFAHQHGYGWLVTDGRRTFRDLEQRDVPAEFADAIEELLLKKRSIRWADILDLRSRTDFSSLDIAGFVVQNALRLELLPFRIWVE